MRAGTGTEAYACCILGGLQLGCNPESHMALNDHEQNQGTQILSNFELHVSNDNRFSSYHKYNVRLRRNDNFTREITIPFS